MSLSLPLSTLLLRSSQLRCSCPSLSASRQTESRIAAGPNCSILVFEDSKETIKKLFDKVELSVSAYDTAWVAMVPSPNSPGRPCFPGSINWILENQQRDGSWGLPDRHPLLIKDSLMSTLACVLALRRWCVGEGQMTKGLDFIGSSFASALDEKQQSPIGFDIIFPAMIVDAIKMDINFHLAQEDIEAILHKKDLELKRVHGKSSVARNFYLAYVSEGLGKLQDWDMVMAYQRKNGSLLNSPSTTAAALSHLENSGCHDYLSSVLQQFGNAVPTVCPIDIYAKLSIVDTLQRLGVYRHFTENISSVLDETFRLWIEGHEDIFSDTATCAMAFRLLFGHGYNVSSEPLAVHCEQDCCFDRFGGHLKDIVDALEIFRASELIIHSNESFLEKQNLWSRHFLKQQLSNFSMGADGFSTYVIREVDDALKNPYHANLDHLANRRYMEHYNLDNSSILKTSFCFTNFSKEHFLKLAVEDFNYCQSVHLQELKQLKCWLIENRLDQLAFCRQRLGYCYFSAAATIFSPELADVRMSWTKNGVLTTVIDDFFDIGGSSEEQLNLISLVEQWDIKNAIDCSSEEVHIIFSALRRTICEIGDKACACQDFSVTGHIVETWLSLMKSMWIEAEMSRNKSVPTMEEYMKNAYISFALGPIVLPALYFLGPKLSEKMITSIEYHNLFELVSTCGRLLNDIRGFEREAKEGKLNALSLHLHHSNGALSEEEAIRHIERVVVGKRRELLRLVLQDEESVVPRACKDLFWKMSKVLHLLYKEDDGFTSQRLDGVVKTLLHDPVALN
ncbi:hypothetical protein Nepgr_004715 [Nepenthes gracilis]|uniref:Uncharacterized protein n=1 Tax=Nepenthes gracilis TaxID=150966 RepID=A0AAD3S1V3_NEPGR|nr:hypothetical protein Nepgr_004715 [Nepenthes gracilis]